MRLGCLCRHIATAAASLCGSHLLSGCGRGTIIAGDAVSTSLSFSEQGGSIAEIPNSYKQGVPNRWVLYLHGFDQDANTILTGSYGEVESSLLNAGYVVIGMTNTIKNCYGNPQCNDDVADVAALYKSKLSLQSEPYVLADSMGGFTALNAIAAQVIHPKAVVGWSINTDLGWDYTVGGAEMPITVDYLISKNNSYAKATAGFDPMMQHGTVFAGVPFELWASYSDTLVPRATNTDPFAALLNASGGSVVVNTASGEHLDPSNFNPAAVIAFFNAH